MKSRLSLYIYSMKKLSLRLFLCLAVACLCSCAGSKNGDSAESEAVTVGAAECPQGESLYGSGLAGSYQTALMLSQRDIAKQMDSLANSSPDRNAGMNVEQREMMEASLAVQQQFLSRLENPENVRVDSSVENAGKFTVTSCMAKANAAIPFKKKYAAFGDSLENLVKGLDGLEKPVEKNSAYKDVKNVYIRMMALRRILVSLGTPVDGAADSLFARVNREHNALLLSNSFFYKKQALPSDTPDSDKIQMLVFSRISRDYRVQQTECKVGVKLLIDVFPVVCETANVGVACSADIHLEGETCQGEQAFELNSKVTAIGAGSEQEVMELLGQEVSGGNWFDEWRNDLNKWSLK